MFHGGWCFSLLQRAGSGTTITLDTGKELLLKHEDLFASLDLKHFFFKTPTILCQQLAAKRH